MQNAGPHTILEQEFSAYLKLLTYVFLGLCVYTARA